MNRESSIGMPGETGPEPGSVIGRFVVIDRLGQGGIGAVLLAYDPELARRVAIKMIRTGIVSPHARMRMVREARAMAQLSHPNVVAIYDVGTYRDNVYLAMEYVEGETLETWISTRRSRREVLSVMEQAGRGLAAAHAAGIVHRDFKPANVIIAKDSRVRVLDFGIALGEPPRDPRVHEGGEGPSSGTSPIADRIVSPASVRGLGDLEMKGADSPSISSLPPAASSWAAYCENLGERLTEEGAIVGTVGYFAPELVFDQPSDARADIFSFCVTLWRALTGRYPFPESSVSEYLDAIFAEPRPPLRDPRVPEWLAKAIERGLRACAEDRYDSVEDLLRALDTREPWRAPIAIGVLAVSIAIAGAATLGKARRDAEVGSMCRAEADAIASLWSPAARGAAGKAMLAEDDASALDRTDRTLERLDIYARTWRDEQAASCEATLIAKTQSEDIHERRSQCLSDERIQFEIVAEMLASPDSRVHRHSLAEANALPAPRLCTAMAARKSFFPLPTEPAAHEASLAARRAILRARVFIVSGALPEAEGFARSAVTLAGDAGQGEMEASAEHVLGTVLAQRLEDEAALREERRAVTRAEAVGADHIGGVAAAAAASLLIDRLKREQEAIGWQELARGKLVRIGMDPILEHAVVRNDVSLASKHDLARALDANERDIGLARDLYGEENEAFCSVLSDRGGLFRALHDAANAEVWGRRSIECRARANGASDPEAPE